jgi:hypothetical protein
VIAAAREILTAAPAAFLTGLVVGLWVGGRYTIRKNRDD